MTRLFFVLLLLLNCVTTFVTAGDDASLTLRELKKRRRLAPDWKQIRSNTPAPDQIPLRKRYWIKKNTVKLRPNNYDAVFIGKLLTKDANGTESMHLLPIYQCRADPKKLSVYNDCKARVATMEDGTLFVLMASESKKHNLIVFIQDEYSRIEGLKIYDQTINPDCSHQKSPETRACEDCTVFIASSTDTLYQINFDVLEKTE